MVLPEDTPDTDRPRSRGRITAVVIAAAALFGGTVALGALTSPDPEAASETTTTSTIEAVDRPSVDPEDFTVADIAQGEQFTWRQSQSFDGFPLQLIEHDGSLYLFSTPGPYWDLQTFGLDIWRSRDGVVWDSRSRLDEPGVGIYSVVSSEHGLMAFGTDQQLRFSAWQSESGSQWTQTPIALDADHGEDIIPHGAVANGDLVVVTGSVQVNVTRVLQEALEDATGNSIDLGALGWDVDQTAEQTVVTVQGPLGLPLIEMPIEELSLTEVQIEWLTGSRRPGELRTWASLDGVNWQEGSIEGMEWIESMYPSNDGSVVALGFGPAGGTAWKSFDGLRWEEMERSPFVNRAQRWGDRLVAASDGGARLLISDDGKNWDDVGLTELFPYEFGWSIHPLAASEGGIAFVAQGFRPTDGINRQPEPYTLTRNHLSLSLDLNHGTLLLEVGETEATWSMYEREAPDWIEVDLPNERVEVADPATGDSVAVFTFDELREAEEAYWTRCCHEESGESPSAFVFSPDGKNWTIQDLSPALGEGKWIGQLHILDGKVLIVTSEGFGRFSGSQPSFEVWSAVIP